MEYKTLSDLGIKRPNEISNYSLSYNCNDSTDILRIKYTRKKGSLLPVAKKFTFPKRKMPGINIDNMTEVSPTLKKAVAELDDILDKDKSNKDRKKELMSELSEFQSYVCHRITEFKSEIDKL